MTNGNLTNSQGIHLSLQNLLHLLDHHPVNTSDNECHYQNVLRRGERSPSLIVHTALNTWFDRNTMKSGNLLDFCSVYWPDLSSDEIVLKLRSLLLRDGQRLKRKRRAVKLPYYHILEVRPLGNNAEITQYLQDMGLWQLASSELMEVYYYKVDEKKKEKHFSAAGWRNENGGWEVRCRNFSGCIGPKGMTFISAEKTGAIALFENFLAYLNWRFANRSLCNDVLILNHPEFREAALRRAGKYPRLEYDESSR